MGFVSQFALSLFQDQNEESHTNIFDVNAQSALEKLAGFAQGTAEVVDLSSLDDAAARLGSLGNDNTAATDDGDDDDATDTDLSDMESVASFASEVRELETPTGKASTGGKSNRSWFTITLGPTEELEEASDNDEDDGAKSMASDGDAGPLGGLNDADWKAALVAAGLDDGEIAAITKAFSPV